MMQGSDHFHLNRETVARSLRSSTELSWRDHLALLVSTALGLLLLVLLSPILVPIGVWMLIGKGLSALKAPPLSPPPRMVQGYR